MRKRFKTKKERSLRIRDIAPEDAPKLVDLFDRLSEKSRYLRFQVNLAHLPYERKLEEARELATLRAGQDVALVAEELGGEAIVAVARCHREPDPAEGEVAILVRDDWQQEGLGTHLIQLLAERARGMKLRWFRSVMLSMNRVVPRLLDRAGLRYRLERLRGSESLLVVFLVGHDS
jgi:acetyltransferase